MNAQERYGKKRILAMQCEQEDVSRVRILLERINLNVREQLLLLEENHFNEFGNQILDIAWLDAGACLELHPERLLRRAECSLTELLKSLDKFKELVEITDDFAEMP
jgi:hypothetical protein